jgi:predicted alpha/beta superfamily hydrolase
MTNSTETNLNRCYQRYLVDGNAYFSTAVDITRRLEFTNRTRAVVVGVGYPTSKQVYDWRRGPDLTPPTADGKYEMPLDENGKPRTDLKFGEADKFLDFIQNDVMTYVERIIFPHIPLSTNRKALFGHSYGGLFTLSALFTRPALFDFFIAASPTIWWNNNSLVKNQEAEFWKTNPSADHALSLMVTWGSSKEELEKELGESDGAFQNRKAGAENKELKPSSIALVQRLGACSSIRNIWTAYFHGEDHGSAAVVGLQRGVIKFLVHDT